MQRLCEINCVAEVISRKFATVPTGFTLTQMDLTQSRNWIAPENAEVISLLPMSVLVQFLPRFIGVKSITIVGPPRHHANSALAESVLQGWCVRSNVFYTLLRPSMTYDCIHDSNITRIAKFIDRYRFLPIAMPAKGLRQPIHADDVAKAIINSLGNDAVYGKTLDIAGGEVLSYREMAERVFHSLGMKPRFLPVPMHWLAKGFALAVKVRLANESAFGESTFHKMNEDMIVDTREGLRLLDYQPRDLNPVFPFL
jgi:nucleoside-diphosphate-sugar epimerase